MFEERINSPKLLAIFQHPCFTYTAKFMPNPQVVEEQSDDDDEMNPLLFSGAYDHLIRVWRVEGSASTGVIPDLSPIKTIEGHGACVNSLAFTKNGSLLVSGDGEGVIKVWTCDRYRGDDVIVECLHTINSSDSNAPVNYIHVHISDRKALITGRNGKLRVLDLRLGRFILEVEVPATAADKAARKPLISINSKQQHPNALSIGTAANNSMRRAIFSPCGSHIYVGGDVGRV